MKIEHLAIWTNDLERLKAFYVKYFGAVANDKYYNPKKEFTSYFLSFGNGCRLEIMHTPHVAQQQNHQFQHAGLDHFAVSLGSKQAVDQLTERLRKDGFVVRSEPRTTGDGYYESVVLDPDGNFLELTV
jgi:lactoylglutathione lyase